MTTEEQMRAALDRLVERADLDLTPPDLDTPAPETGGSIWRGRRRGVLVAALLVVATVAGTIAWFGRTDDPERVTTDPTPQPEDPSLPRDPGWQRVDDFPITGVTSASTVWSGDELFVVGSYLAPCRPDLDCVGPGEPSAETAALDLDTGLWRHTADLPEALAAPSLAVVEGIIYAWPSGIGSEEETGRLYSYDIAGDEWTLIEAPFSPQFGYQLVAADDLVLVVTGSDERGDEPIRAYQPDTGQWLVLPDDPLPPLFDKTVMREGDAVYLFGKEIAKVGGTEPPLVIGARLDLSTDAWSELPISQAVPYQLEYVGDGRLIYPSLNELDGGTVNNWGRSYPEGVIFDTRTDTWRPLPEPPPGLAAGTAGFLGIDNLRYPAFGGPMLDMVTDTWIDVPAAPGVDHTSFRTVAAAGTQAVVLAGGWDDAGGPDLLADVWIWNPPVGADETEQRRADTYVTTGDHRCRRVDRPTSGEGSIPQQPTGEALAAQVTWSNQFVLDPPAPDDQPAVTVEDVAVEGFGDAPVTVLARLTDPLHRTFMGDGRLVWATFYPQMVPIGPGGPYPPPGETTTTTNPDEQPCAMAMQPTDALTGERYGFVAIG